MKKCFAVVFVFLTLIGSSVFAQTDPKLPPDQLVVEVSNDVLDEIRRDPALSKADPNHIRQLVDEHILPYTDFPRMTRLAVGPGWRKASANQRETIQTEFRRLLIAVYSGALTEVQDYKVQLRNYTGKLTDRQVLVRTTLVSKTKEPISLDYRLLNDEGTWKIFDVNVGGVWLVENYRSQFASVVNNSGIDGLITQLKERTSKFERN